MAEPIAPAGPTASTALAALTLPQGLAYGLMGLPLAFVALPLYVVLPHHYASTLGAPLAALGGVLLGARLLDALVDPGLGRLADRLLQHSPRAVWRACAVAGALLALALWAVFMPQVRSPGALLVWAAVGLALAYPAYSLLSITHQAWGARLGGNEAQRGRVVAWREGAGLLGVVLASVLPTLLGVPAMLGAFSGLLVLGWLAWHRAPVPPPLPPASDAAGPAGLWQPWRQAAFRRLMGVFVLNGIASAVPATLLLFFVQDRLQAAPGQEPVLLGLYFLSAAAAMPLWLRAVARWGLAPCWLAGMLLAVAVFAWATTLGAGQVMAFRWICALSGLTLGADLVVPGALLAGVLAQPGAASAGASFGWWNFANKLNLALAAGLALPLLAALGYTPGSTDAAGLQALSLGYAALPCALKLAAALALYGLILRPAAQDRARPGALLQPSPTDTP
ncbi:MFS transporter [Curvibacter gracilis]|uniref:MFS transporter n=1 Tax=Curvibacter gracilis TaxID=230310 RepID=UPI000484CF20|nr:MFS transporter [Curvibacter gracilis]